MTVFAMSMLEIPEKKIRTAQGMCEPHTETWFRAVGLSAYQRSNLLAGRVGENTAAKHLQLYLKVFSGELTPTPNEGSTAYDALKTSRPFKEAARAIKESLAAWRPGEQTADESAGRPIIRARIKNERELFGIKPTFAQADERGALVVVEAWFGEPDWEITDEQDPSQKADTVSAAINLCWLSVDWPSGEIESASQRWANTDGAEYKLERQGLSGEPFWKVESALSGEPLRGLVKEGYLCRLIGPDRSDATVSMALKAAGMKLRYRGQEDLHGIERLRVFERLLVNAIEQGFESNSEVVVFSGTPKSISEY